ncbi:MAG TPA: copper amine oxidase N-terminal domain-containing protein [Clostridia bacterium]|nr:copper amine oxidase N-terminal domain-containing protein [Clostridia bacterium]
MGIQSDETLPDGGEEAVEDEDSNQGKGLLKEAEKQEKARIKSEEKAAVKAAREEAKEVRLASKVRVRGWEIKFDVPPVIKEGRTLIPVRAVSEGMGAEVSWDESTKTVTISKEDTIIEIILGSQEMLVNGEKVLLDVPAESIENRTLVPLRFIAEALGLKVDYDDETGDIDLDEEEDDELEDADDPDEVEDEDDDADDEEEEEENIEEESEERDNENHEE